MTTDDDQPPRTPATPQAGTGRRRRANGTFIPSATTAKRDAQAAALYCDGWTYRRIADELGWAAHKTAQEAVERGLRALRTVGLVEARTAALERLQASRQTAAEMEAAARAVLARRHVVTNNKGVIYGEENEEGRREPLEDSAPKLAAIDRVIAARRLVLAADEREAKLLGLDAEEKIQLNAGVRYEIVGVDPADIIGQEPAGT